MTEVEQEVVLSPIEQEMGEYNMPVIFRRYIESALAELDSAETIAYDHAIIFYMRLLKTHIADLALDETGAVDIDVVRRAFEWLYGEVNSAIAVATEPEVPTPSTATRMQKLTRFIIKPEPEQPVPAGRLAQRYVKPMEYVFWAVQFQIGYQQNLAGRDPEKTTERQAFEDYILELLGTNVIDNLKGVIGVPIDTKYRSQPQ